MKPRTVVAMVFIGAMFTVTGWAQDEAVKKEAPAENSGALLFSSPVCGRPFRVISYFGEREIQGRKSNHPGVDIRVVLSENCKTEKGKDPDCSPFFPVCAVEDGEVTAANYEKGGGNTVIIKHDDHISTVYTHAQKLLVKNGQKVKRGDKIMLAGSTGISTGIHLHIEVRKDGVVVDPEKFMSLDGSAYDSRKELIELK